jgi:hypothetical protein
MKVRPRIFTLVILLSLAWLTAGLGTVQATTGPAVPPVFEPGNPTCTALGYDLGFKPQPEPPPSGTYTFPGTTETVTIVSDGTYFSWTSTLGIDAVIVKGGPNANVYKYDPESYGDAGLSSPINDSNGKPYGISHIEFCYDFNLEVTKTADAKFTRTYSWTIDKSVAPAAHVGLPGDKFASDYSVAVDQTVADTDFMVAGTITVKNPSPFTVEFGITDVVGGTPATVNCDTYILAPGASTTCSYTASFGNTNPGDGTNTATIVSKNDAVAGATASASYTFKPVVTGYETVNVTDSVKGALGSTSADKTFPYSGAFSCPTDPSLYKDGVYTAKFPNTATIVETSQSDSAEVTVTCYAPVVSKTAEASMTRTWQWTIEKTGDKESLKLAVGQSYVVNYTVVVKAASTDAGWMVAGQIFVKNPSPSASMTVNVSDVLDDGTVAAVDCDPGTAGDQTTLTVAAGQTGTCTYKALPTGTIATKNTATAAIGGASFNGTALVDFSKATIKEVDECIAVKDDKAGTLGTICAKDLPKTFTYKLTVGPYDKCALLEYVNIASFTANDTGATGSDSWTVKVDVPCATGCTLTQGYWKTHSKYGPAPYDDTWALIGEDTTFYLSGQTWYQVLWTAPRGNAYYNLAHQFIAAQLNILNGASTTAEVDTALAYAKTFFTTHQPGDTLSKADRAKVLAAASTLDKYNNGYIGPGHCSEDSTSVAGFAEALDGPALFLPAVTK